MYVFLLKINLILRLMNDATGTSPSFAQRELASLPGLKPKLTRCNSEILAFNDALPQFKELNTTVLGTSVSPQCHPPLTFVQPSPPTPSTLTSHGQPRAARRVALDLTSRSLSSQTATCRSPATMASSSRMLALPSVASSLSIPKGP